jgi:hypothetical protein
VSRRCTHAGEWLLVRDLDAVGPARTPSFAEPQRYPTAKGPDAVAIGRVGSGPRSIAIGDLNGDGRPDLVTANTNTTASGDRVDTVSVLLNRATAPFGPS